MTEGDRLTEVQQALGDMRSELREAKGDLSDPTRAAGYLLASLKRRGLRVVSDQEWDENTEIVRDSEDEANERVVDALAHRFPD